MADIEAAATRIEGVAVRTPLVDSPALSKRLGRKVYLKLECFQPIRVFKIRGAYNKLSQVKEDSVVAISSGNHGIAVAFSSRAFGKKCTVFLPENPVQEKADAIEEYGATIVKYGKFHNEREEKARQLVKETGAALIHPFNDPDIIAGISIAVKARSPSTKIFGVEPATAAKLTASMNAGRLVSIENPHSIADGLIPPSVGDLTFKACSENVSGVFTVSDDEIMAGMKALIREARIFPEPSSSAPLAALLAGRETDRLGEKVVLVVSGGNVSQKLLGQVLTS